jgi:hypothetical protein
MYRALEEARRRTGRKLVLVQCGWFANEAIERAFKASAEAFAPGVRALFIDGRDPPRRDRSWAAADIFISLSDNIQETFGLSPLEAMARGLPVIVSDWDGYRETVRHEIDGFRVATAMPAEGHAADIVAAFEANVLNYDQYCAAMCRLVSIDHEDLARRLSELILDESLRHKMGAAGAARAQDTFDWAVIYRRYRDLYDELAELRTAALARGHSAPRQSSTMLDPTRTFAHYPSRVIGPATRVRAASPDGAKDYAALAGDVLYSYLPELLTRQEAVDTVFARLADGLASVDDLARAAGLPLTQAVQCVAVLAKMGLVAVEP